MGCAHIIFSFVVLTGAIGLSNPHRLLCQDGTIKPEQKWQGMDSRIETPEYHRIMTAEAWEALWKRHAAKDDKLPKVDFDQSMVVVVLPGRSESLRVDSLAGAKSGDKGIEMTFQLVESDARTKGGAASYLMVQIPNSKQKLTLKSRLVSPADKVRPRPPDAVVKVFDEIKS